MFGFLENWWCLLVRRLGRCVVLFFLFGGGILFVVVLMVWLWCWILIRMIWLIFG